MKHYETWLRRLTDCMSISGFERTHVSTLLPHLEAIADKVSVSRLGSILVSKQAQKKDAPTLLIDAHFDQIGMVVSGHKEGGFLTLAAVGGLDSRILPAADVTVFGERPIFGVIISTPPHLQKAEDKDKLKPLSELLVDTGYSKEEIEKIAPIGTPVCFRGALQEQLNDRVIGIGLDNKACGAAALCALEQMDPQKMQCHVTVMLSSFEETGGKGAVTGTVELAPDYAAVLDVNFACAPGVSADDAIKMGEGPSISHSVLTDRALTRQVIALAKGKDLPLQEIVEVGNLGTNANTVPLQLCGIRTVNMSLPLSSMHTATEIISMADGVAMARLLCTMTEEPHFFEKEAAR